MHALHPPRKPTRRVQWSPQEKISNEHQRRTIADSLRRNLHRLRDCFHFPTNQVVGDRKAPDVGAPSSAGPCVTESASADDLLASVGDTTFGNRHRPDPE